MQGIFVGRQPIFDQRLKVVGYELLFRDDESNKANIKDGDQATSQVILNSFMEIGLERLIGKKMAFINLTRSFILGKHPIPFIEDRVVLEILESISIDDELIDALKGLTTQGFRLALDDVINPRKVGPLLNIANIVKLDIMRIEQSRLKEFTRHLRQYNVQLLAEKIETLDIFKYCRSLNMDYFQGYFLSRPNVVTGQRIPPARVTILRLLAKLQNPDLEIREIEKIISQDVSLSYKLLRLINSVFYKTTVRVNSINQALTLLGLRQIRDWVSLIFLSNIEDKPRELMVTAMVRAKMCEILATKSTEKVSESGFTVGLFSVLDALLDISMEEALASLPLSDEIKGFLLRQEGRLGTILKCVIAYERGNWPETRCLDVSPETIVNAYLQSIDWATGVGTVLES